MSEESGQNFENHTRIDPKSVVVSILVLLTVILGAVGIVKGSTTLVGLGVVSAGITLLGAFLTARLYSVNLQDRIIRTEMRIRLRDVLDADLGARAESLSTRQCIGLRFASDAELPGLVAKVLDENITDLVGIKKMVTDWQGDYHRV